MMSSGFYSQNGRWPDPKSSRQKGGAGYFPNYKYFLYTISVLLLVVEACVWRDVEVVWVGNVASLLSARAFVWGDVDPHDCGLDAGEPNGSAVVVEIRAPALLVCPFLGFGMQYRSL